MKTIIIDMDDVMADASEGILDIFNELNKTDLKRIFDDKNFYEFMNSGKYITYRDKLFEPGFS